ncbi:MAG: hypothetical protein ACRCW2_08405 [Cellulosilyticaceae bacterium]
MRDSIADGIGKRAWNESPFNQSVMDLDYESNWKKLFDKCGEAARTLAQANGPKFMKGQPVQEGTSRDYEASELDDDDENAPESEVTVQEQVAVPRSTGPKHVKNPIQAGLMDPTSIQSAIVLAEILGPPRCKTRSNRMGRKR